MALAIDGSTPVVAVNSVASTATVTTASFTPPAGALLLVLWSGNSSPGVNPSTPTITDNLGVHLTYTLIDWDSHPDTPFVDGQAATWRAVVGSSAAMTVTVTSGVSGSDKQSALRVVVITGQHATPTGAHGKSGSTSAASIAQSFTGTATSSQGFLVDCDWDVKGAQTAGTGCTLLSSANIGTAITYGFHRRTTADGTNGGSTAMNATLPGTSTALTWCYVEVVPADITAPPPVVADFTTAAVTAARTRAGIGQAILIRTPAGAASTADAAVPETFGLTADATRAAAGDVTLAETFGLSVDATVTSATRPPVVAGFTTAAVTAARGAFTRVGRPVVLRGPVGATATADATLPETFGLSVDATRAATADSPIGSTFGLSVDASTSSSSTPAPAPVDFTDAAVVAARAAYGRPGHWVVLRAPTSGATAGDVTFTETFGLSVAATRAATADSSVPSVFGLSVDATTGAASPQPAAFDFTDAASAAALWYRSRVVEPVITWPPGVASSNPTADVVLTETFGLSVTATRAATTAATIPITFGLTTDATRSVAGAVSIGETFGLSVTATASTPGTAQVTLTETFGLTTTAVLGAAGAATIPETFGLAAAATRNTAGAGVLAESFALTADAIRGVSAATAVGSTFGLTVAAIITTGFPADGTAGPGSGATIHAGPGAGIPATIHADPGPGSPAARATGGA